MTTKEWVSNAFHNNKGKEAISSKHNNGNSPTKHTQKSEEFNERHTKAIFNEGGEGRSLTTKVILKKLVKSSVVDAQPKPVNVQKIIQSIKSGQDVNKEVESDTQTRCIDENNQLEVQHFNRRVINSKGPDSNSK